MNRVCKYCKIDKDIDEFPVALIENGKTYRRHACAKCYYLNNTSQNTKRIRAWFEDYKKTLKCSRCPEDDFRTLDFHHLDRDKKCFHISDAAARGWGKETILEEVSKCEILCANCHRKLTYDERKVASYNG